jgi:hypothetical protein
LCLALLGAFDCDDFSVPIQILEMQSPDFATSQPVDGKQHQGRLHRLQMTDIFIDIPGEEGIRLAVRRLFQDS